MTGIKDFISASGKLINYSLGLLIGAALLIFLWGLAKTIINGGDKKASEEGRNLATWGLLALFVMISVWGVIAFMQRALNLSFGGYGGEATQNLPSRDYSFFLVPAKQPQPGNAPEPGVLPSNNFWSWFLNNPAKQPQPGNAPIPNSLNPRSQSSQSGQSTGGFWSRIFGG